MDSIANSQFLSDDITRNFYSFYDFSTIFKNSTVYNDYTAYDRINKNHLTQGFVEGYGTYGKGGKFNGLYSSSLIDYVISNYPYFLFSSMKYVSSGGVMRISPRADFYPSNYLEGAGIEVGYSAGIAHGYTGYNNGFLYRISEDMPISGNVLNIAMIVRDHDDFSVYVNGSKGTIALSNGGSPSLTPAQTLSVGGSYPYGLVNGTMFFAGFGKKDPGDSFFRRLTSNPLQTIFQRTSFKNAQWTGTPRFRRSFSLLGTRIGSRGTNV